MEIMRAAQTSPSIRKGTNPILATQRSKIQSERASLNQQLNKQLRLRAGAENLYNASSNLKVKDTVALELSFLNSNLQLLKEELSDINSRVGPYQSESGTTKSIPMISLGLKETQTLDFSQALKDFILEHYSEDPDDYEDEIADLTDLRNSIRTPARTSDGVELLLEYYNQLYFIDHRFFPPNRPLGIQFHWYDSITGIPSMQKFISLERASALFNVAALYSQLGSRADRSRRERIDEAIDAYESAAGAFDYVRMNFSHAPCTDLSQAFLAIMTKLMLAQAQECAFERLLIGGFEIELGKCISIAQEAAKVSEKYSSVHTAMSVSPIKDSAPSSWAGMIKVKSFHYKALAHYYAGVGLLQQREIAEVDEISNMISTLHLQIDNDDEIPTADDVAKRKEDRNRLGRAHLRQAIAVHEKAKQAFKICKPLSKIDTLQDYLDLAHKRSVEKRRTFTNTDDFFEIINVPEIQSQTQTETKPRPPNFAEVRANDIFKKLGPLTVFSARHNFTAPRPIKLTVGTDGWGCKLMEGPPVSVQNVSQELMKQGLKNGDIVTEVEGENVKLHSCSQVTELIQTCVSRQKKDHEDKNQNIKIIEVENELDSTPFSVCIKVVTLYGSMIPQTSGKLSQSDDIETCPDTFGHMTNGGTPRPREGKNKTFPVKRRYKQEGNKSLASYKNRNSLGFLHGIKLKLRTNSFSTPTNNPYASTHSLDTWSKDSKKSRPMSISNFATISIPKASERQVSISRSDTFTDPKKPKVTMFTKSTDIGTY